MIFTKLHEVVWYVLLSHFADEDTEFWIGKEVKSMTEQVLELQVPSCCVLSVTHSVCSHSFHLLQISSPWTPPATAPLGPCLPPMKKRSASGPVEVNGPIGASGPVGASGQGVCLPVLQGTPCPGTCHCMSRKNGKARIRCWTLLSVLWSELLVRKVPHK
jgi:hypothetical protein